MKKGLRPGGGSYLSSAQVNEHRPDEKGIATAPGRYVYVCACANEHRPDEKGIATGVKDARRRLRVRNEHRPDEKGIATCPCPRPEGGP